MQSILITFIRDLAFVLILAFTSGLLFTRYRQSVVLGFLLAGALIGPFGLGFVSSTDIIDLFADLGAIMLMFYFGLEFSIKKLRRVGGVAIFAGTIEMAFMLLIGIATGQLLGWSHVDSIFLGGVLAFSSTAIIRKILADFGHLGKSYANIVLGILIVEDIAAVILLTALGALASLGTLEVSDILNTSFRIVFFFLVAMAFGRAAIPGAVDWINKNSRSPELTMLTVTGLCFAMAVFSDYLGFSVALGAFMMGSIISESRSIDKIKREIEPVKDLFATIFFISIGMLLNLHTFKETSFLLILFVIILIRIAGKFLGCSMSTYAYGIDGLTAIYAGAAMIQIGEFSFIIAKSGSDMGVLNPSIYQVIVAAAIATAFITPQAIKRAETFAGMVSAYVPTRIKQFIFYMRSLRVAISENMMRDSDSYSRFKRDVIDVAVNCIIILIILAVIPLAGGYITEATPEWFDVRLISFIAAMVLILPSTYIIIRGVKDLTDLLADLLAKAHGLHTRIGVKHIISNVMYLLVLLVLAFSIFPVIMGEVRQYSAIWIAGILIVILLSTYFFKRTINRFHDRVEAIIMETIFADKTELTTADKQEVENLVEYFVKHIKEKRYIEEVEMPVTSPAAGKSIAELQLRTRTGSIVLSINRDGKIITNPGPDEKLRGRDRIVLLGSEEERANAKKILLASHPQ